METPESTLSDHSHMKNSDVSSDSGSNKSDRSMKKILVDSYFYFKISAWFFGNSVVTSSITGVIWPHQIASMVNNDPREKEYWNGIIPIAGMLVNLIMLVVIGYMSDETRTRFGKRRPYIFVGTIIMIAFLMGLAPYKKASDSKGEYIALQVGFNFGQGMAAGAFAGIIPDIVPLQKAGIASGWLGVTWSLGALTGTLITGRILNDYMKRPYDVEYFTINGIMCAILGVSAIIALFSLYEDSCDTTEYKGTVRKFMNSLYLPSKTYYDFYWVILTRFFNTMGVSTILGYFYYFTLNVLGRSGTMDYSIVYSVMIVFSLPASIAGGYLADYFDTKKLVYVSSFIQFAAVSLYILITHHPSWAGMLAIVGLFGVGYGFYQCVDWALALRVLPQRNIGKDMGIWHIAFNLPTVIAPPIVSAIFRFQGKDKNLADPVELKDYYETCYSITFGIAAFYFLLATVLIYPLRVHEPPKSPMKDIENNNDNNNSTKMNNINGTSATIETD